MKRHIRLGTTSGYTKIHCAIKDGCVMTYWFYMKIGSQWYPFDIRDVAKRLEREIPKLVHGSHEQSLANVTQWCLAANAQDTIRGLYA